MVATDFMVGRKQSPACMEVLPTSVKFEVNTFWNTQVASLPLVDGKLTSVSFSSQNGFYMSKTLGVQRLHKEKSDDTFKGCHIHFFKSNFFITFW